MKVYVLQESRCDETTTKGVAPSIEAADAWALNAAKESVSKSLYKGIEKIEDGYNTNSTSFYYEEFELNLGVELTGIGLFDKAHDKAVCWANRGKDYQPDISTIYTHLYNMLHYDTIIRAFIVQEGCNINPEGAQRAKEIIKRNQQIEDERNATNKN